MDAWYFAYGSNLWTDQMIARTGSIGRAEEPPRVARLANYRLTFVHLMPGEPAYANIVPVGPEARDYAGNGVLGVVYRCSAEQLAKLDVFEHGYDRHSIEVVDMAGEDLPATVYIVRPADAVNIGRPNDEYLQRITTGARQHALPESYVAEIVAIATIADNAT